ncbi:MAG TPA: energy transducer TonB [Desulfurella acetivorans]|uniref:Energy transducer TonB n=1 Tax=Desulfurella acetivorans TaxID=33002 RepID=A0A7C6EB99_DESAE|nr:energy transducer TonB [Desulfurella acetivorans]
MKFLSFTFSVVIHLLLIVLVYLLTTHTKKPITKLSPPVYHVDIVQLPKQEQNTQQKQPHIIASNINRKAQSRIYSKTEKIPLKSIPQSKAKSVQQKPQTKEQKVAKPSPHQEVTKNSQVLKQPKPPPNSTKQQNLAQNAPYKISGNLFSQSNKNAPAINPNQKYQGLSKVKEYESPNSKKEATIEIGTESIKYVSYMKLLKNKIQNVWVYPEQARLKNQQGTLLVEFGINKNGSLAYAKVIRSSGYTILDEAAIKAIREASPFNPLPDRFGIDRLNIYATFTYELVYYYVQ